MSTEGFASVRLGNNHKQAYIEKESQGFAKYIRELISNKEILRREVISI
jgi:hypothetical protein